VRTKGKVEIVSLLHELNLVLHSSHCMILLSPVRSNLSWNFDWTFYKDNWDLRPKIIVSIALLFTRAWYNSSHYNNLPSFVRSNPFWYFNWTHSKIIKMWDLRLWSQLFYILRGFDLVLNSFRYYPFLLWSKLL
jgi:hypothetical protein